MASFVLKNASVKVATIDLTDHVKEVEVALSVDDVEVTAMGAGGKQHLAGIHDDKFSVTFYSDFAAGKVDETLIAQFSGASAFLVEVWPNGTTTAATNPRYAGTAIMLNYSPVAGGFGDASMTQVEMPVNGTISRSTS
jgi:hypothetical protein